MTYDLDRWNAIRCRTLAVAVALVLGLAGAGCYGDAGDDIQESPAASQEGADTEASTASAIDVSQTALLARIDAGEEMLILDVRRPDEYASGHVPGAVNIPHTELVDRLAQTDAFRDKPVVLYCERGGRAGRAADILLEAGYRSVQHLEGDMSGWRAAGLTSETPNDD